MPPSVRVATAPAAASADAVAAAADAKQSATDLIAEFCRRFFSEARALARAKMWTFAGFLGFLGLGFTLKIGAINQVLRAVGPVEFILASPDLAAIIGGLAGLCLVIGGNLFSRMKLNSYRRQLYELAANPATPDDVREAILKELAGR